MKKSNAGFTLIELIVVIVILGIIVAIFFPVFAKSHIRHDRHASCISNEMHLGTALQQYLYDHDDKLPDNHVVSGHLSVNTVHGTEWAGNLYSYFKFPKMFQCPVDQMEFENSVSPSGNFPVSYALNSNCAGHTYSNYSAPGKTIWIFEVSNVNAKVNSIDEGRTSGAVQVSAAGNGVNGRLSSSLSELPNANDPVRYATGMLDNSALAAVLDQYAGQKGRHNNASNFLLADGHVKWFNPKAVSAGGTALKTNAPQSSTGCAADGSKYPGAYPCAEGTANDAHKTTFSVN